MKITPKENYLRLGRGEDPAYIPRFTMMGDEYLGEACCKMLQPMVFPMNQFVDGGYDMWGVRYRADANTGATLPEPGNFILEDIADWEKVIKFPERPEGLDYEKMYEHDLKAMNINRELSATMAGPGLMPFQQLVAFMGFTEGLCALVTDPDSVKDMLNAMVDWIEPVMYATVEYYKPDIWYILDDSAAKQTPFFSLEIYKDVFKPIYTRLAKPATDRGIPVEFHNCGKFQIQIPDMLDFGVKYTDPAQETNDLLDLQKKYHGKLCLVGGWDWDHHIPANWPDFEEEEIRQGVRDAIDKYGPGGGYAFGGGVPGMNEAAARVNEIVRDEVHWYGRKFTGYVD
ncbi:MAG: veratrol--corrinoid protein metyltransferase [Oscillospiraceae bacterium]|nr:veratrol--corrinoid protein metyltransferase [Oscillospiraceae bacterium]